MQDRESLRPKLYRFNASLTIAMPTRALIIGVLPIAVLS